MIEVIKRNVVILIELFLEPLLINMNKQRLATYIWVDSDGNPRSKSRIVTKEIKSVDDLPVWNFDGSSTNQAEGKFSDVYIHPRRLYKDPFRYSDDVLVLCDCWDDEKTPNKYNTRIFLERSYAKFKYLEPLSGLEQEYIIFDRTTNLPYGWKGHNEPGSGKQGPYFCGTGGNYSFGRSLAENHIKMCIEAGVHIYGLNSEDMPAQWEFQIGTVDPLTLADDLTVARYILRRLTETSNSYVTFHPKPYLGNWSGSGGHINFSTKEMREDGGIKKIEQAIKCLQEHHDECIEVYGKDNRNRLVGEFETEIIDKFSWGVGNRLAAVRIPKEVWKNKKGFFEDRRPAANVDAYLALDKVLNIVGGIED